MAIDKFSTKYHNKVSYEQAKTLCDLVLKEGSELFELDTELLDENKRQFNKDCTFYYPLKIKSVFEYKGFGQGYCTRIYKFPETEKEKTKSIILNGYSFYENNGEDFLSVNNCLKGIKKKLEDMEDDFSVRKIICNIIKQRNFELDKTIDLYNLIDEAQKYQDNAEKVFNKMYETIDKLFIAYGRQKQTTSKEIHTDYKDEQQTTSKEIHTYYKDARGWKIYNSHSNIDYNDER